MDWQRENEQNRKAVIQIVTLLLSLATLCERISRAPCVIRSLILFILRPAEAVGRAYAIDVLAANGCWADLPAPGFFQHGDGRTDALRLGLRFQVLAEVLKDLLDYFDFDVSGAQFEHLASARFTSPSRGAVAPQPVVMDIPRAASLRVDPPPWEPTSPSRGRSRHRRGWG